MQVFTVQDASKGVAVIHTTLQDAIAAAKWLKSNNTRQQYRVFEFTLEHGQSHEFYKNRCIFDTRSV